MLIFLILIAFVVGVNMLVFALDKQPQSLLRYLLVGIAAVFFTYVIYEITMIVWAQGQKNPIWWEDWSIIVPVMLVLGLIGYALGLSPVSAKER